MYYAVLHHTAVIDWFREGEEGVFPCTPTQQRHTVSSTDQLPLLQPEQPWLASAVSVNLSKLAQAGLPQQPG
jgi:hypothetical protein